MTGRYDAVVIGAGGAGLMCAATAGRLGARVMVIDHNDQPGRKILISGGGRCNFTNRETPPERFLSANPHFAKSALGRYPPARFIELLARHRITWHEKTLGQLFCDGSARQIVDMLMSECAGSAVSFAFGSPVGPVDHDGSSFRIHTAGREIHSRALVIATGGPSIPKLGASGYAYELARQFGLKVVEPRPALVPLLLDENERLFRALSGVATTVIARCAKAVFREAALFTHRGLSGPAILQVSSYWRPGEPVRLNFLPDAAPGWLLKAKRERPRASLATILSGPIPSRLAQALCERLAAGWPTDRPLSAMTDRDLTDVALRLADWTVQPSGTEGFAKAEVTVGGIATDRLSSTTLQARDLPGLYAIGEAVDVTGWLGGYNFQWAWASGWAAGQAIGEQPP